MMHKLLRSPHATLAAALAISASAGIAACNQAGDDAAADDGKIVDPPATQALAGHCVYTSPFTMAEECLEYHGDGWSDKAASDDCSGRDGSAFTKTEPCVYPKTLGRCVLQKGTADETQIVFPGEDTTQCESFQRGCEVFGGGAFVPDLCEGAVTDPGGGGSKGVFEWPAQVCVDPVAGEPAGQSNGKVCTWGSISGCTEAGRNFSDYGKCDTVLTQRPYWPAPRSEYQTPAGDPRLTDPGYQAELAWVKEQVDACACVCCHSEKSAPGGKTSNWYVEAGPIWTDSFDPSGLALAAGWVDSTSFGAYPPEDNNGFSRDVTGLPTTDPTRMKAFFEGELARRGYKKEDFVNDLPFGGPLYDQSVYVPTACDAGQGVDAAGKITWTGGGARYLYVLEDGAKNPGVPPNLDLPEGTIYRFDVASSADAVKSGVTYGEAPAGAKQVFPEGSAPAKLVPGKTYYLYVLADVAVPITRCKFTFPQ